VDASDIDVVGGENIMAGAEPECRIEWRAIAQGIIHGGLPVCGGSSSPHETQAPCDQRRRSYDSTWSTLCSPGQISHVI
jgi:hypothetical protein